MTDTTQAGQAENSLWDDMAQALAAAQERITELEAQLAWKEGLIQQLTNVDMAAMDAQIERLTAQLAERSEWEVVEDGEYQDVDVDANGSELITVTKDVHGIEWDAMIMLPDNMRLCRRVQREDE